ncbi:hypothetical protein GCM10011390_11670 [Aureimonas endophytica]|uniref:Uncharacterized protein n=1 Tax=Aureimonas endophytica TaxID=2027858 RepID=A0A916ZGE7_9HYPH|nr:hypothetical protein [Aureimonas endophytica]GGD94577.1 hypothetical protein GCM10011390_11670 [Aureimonas endophytica]
MIDGRMSLDGTSVEDRIEGSVYRARDEFETLDAIVTNGIRSWQFQGDDLIEFVRRCIYAMVDAGAKPFDGDIGGVAPNFYPTDRWGTTREDIADSLIAEWQRQGGGELPFWSYAFAFVEDYYPDGWPEPRR